MLALLPMEKTDPLLPIDSTEPQLPTLSIDAALATLSKLAQLNTDNMLYELSTDHRSECVTARASDRNAVTCIHITRDARLVQATTQLPFQMTC